MAEKTVMQLVIDALMTGNTLKAADVVEMIGPKADIREVSSLLSRFSNRSRCDLGNFVEKKQENGIFVYKMVEEALKLTSEQAYDLSMKKGYSLKQALEDYPALEKYIGEKPVKMVVRKTATQLITEALMTGNALKTDDVAEMTGRGYKDVSSLLSRISDRCALGNFIEKKQENGIFVYKMVEEALKFTLEQAYGLCLKTGYDAYSLEQALKDYPALKKYVGEKPVKKPVKKVVKK